jgi:hypothetical protein
LNENLQLRLAFQEATQLQISSDEYRANVCDAIENDREGPFPKARIPLVVDMIQAQVPEDALAKVQRRFRLLDRGPALVRQQPVLRKGRRPAKHE